MNVSATTVVANTAKVGSTTTDRIGTVTNGKITTIRVLGDTTIDGNVYVKTTLGGSDVNGIISTNTDIRTNVTKNIADLDALDTRQDQNEVLFDGISGEYNEILKTEFPTADKILDLSGRCASNEESINGISYESYLLETANAGGYPADAELEDLSGRVDENVAELEILFIRVYGLKDDALDGDFASVSYANGIEARIVQNETNIQDASDGYAYALANASTLATLTNYNDLSGRATDVSNTLAFIVDDPNPFGINDVSNRVLVLGQDTSYTEDLCNGLLPDIQYQTPRIVDLSQNISVTDNGIMIGVNAIEPTSDVVIGEDLSQNATYFNAKVTNINGRTTISGTAVNIIQPRATIDTDYVDISRDVSSIVVDFTSVTPYSHTHHIILDPSEGLVADPPFILTDQYGALIAQADGGVGLDLRISRLSKSRRIVVTVPPTTASRLTVTLYDDDTFTTVNGGYGISDLSDVRRNTMLSNMGQFTNILTGSGLVSETTYKLRDSIHISPGCAPSIDVSFLSLNSTQKSAVVSLLSLDTKNMLDPAGVPRLQYAYNPINTDHRTLHGGSVFHTLADVSENLFLNQMGLTQENYYRLRFLSAMNDTDGINSTNNVTLNGLPSFLLNQTVDRDSNGNRFDIIFGGASKIVHKTGNSPPLVADDEIASPFDYYGGNSYTFEINLVSTGRVADIDLAKIYITEKTRQVASRRFYNNRFFEDVNNIENITDGALLVARFDSYKLGRRKVYEKLIANPVVEVVP